MKHRTKIVKIIAISVLYGVASGWSNRVYYSVLTTNHRTKIVKIIAISVLYGVAGCLSTRIWRL